LDYRCANIIVGFVSASGHWNVSVIQIGGNQAVAALIGRDARRRDDRRRIAPPAHDCALK
jgi:hypothetical protein